MKIYIAGPITDDPDYREKFNAAEEAFALVGHAVLNPAKLPEGMTPADYMRICFAMIDVADIVAFLPGWLLSKGAKLERNYCRYTGKKFVFIETKPVFTIREATAEGAVVEI